jgi:hypothetical protein
MILANYSAFALKPDEGFAEIMMMKYSSCLDWGMGFLDVLKNDFESLDKANEYSESKLLDLMIRPYCRCYSFYFARNIPADDLIIVANNRLNDDANKRTTEALLNSVSEKTIEICGTLGNPNFDMVKNFYEEGFSK